MYKPSNVGNGFFADTVLHTQAADPITHSDFATGGFSPWIDPAHVSAGSVLKMKNVFRLGNSFPVPIERGITVLGRLQTPNDHTNGKGVSVLAEVQGMAFCRNNFAPVPVMVQAASNYASSVNNWYPSVQNPYTVLPCTMTPFSNDGSACHVDTKVVIDSMLSNILYFGFFFYNARASEQAFYSAMSSLSVRYASSIEGTFEKSF